MWGTKVHTNKSDGMKAEGLGSILAARTPHSQNRISVCQEEGLQRRFALRCCCPSSEQRPAEKHVA